MSDGITSGIKISGLLNKLKLALYHDNIDTRAAFKYFFELVGMIGNVKKRVFINNGFYQIKEMYFLAADDLSENGDRSEFAQAILRAALKEYSHGKKFIPGMMLFSDETVAEFGENIPIDLGNTVFFFLREGDVRTSGLLCVELHGGDTWTADSIEFVVSICDFFGSCFVSAHQTHRALENEKALERILDSVDALIYVNDIVTNEILFVNLKMKEAFGLADTDVKNRRCWEVFQSGMKDVCSFCPVHTQRGLSDKPIIWQEHNTKTGRYYQNTDRIIKWIDGRDVHIQHSVDVTETREAQNALATAQRTLQTVFNSVPVAIFWKDRNGIFEGVNQLFCQMSGFTEEELIGFSDYEIHSAELSEIYKDEDLKLLSGEVEMIEDERKFGGRWVHLKKVPIRDENGDISQVLGIAEDISQRKQDEIMLLEKQLLLEKAIEDSMEASRAKSAFLSRMSHEIRTPMNAIVGMTRIIRDSDDITKIKNSLDKITNASDQLMNIINDVLDMSKIEADKLALVMEEIDFEQLLMNVSDILSIKSDEKKQTLNFFVDKNIPTSLVGDGMRLSQVITNILSNAIKFTPEQGEITLRAYLKSLDTDTVNIEFSIRDTGIGISDEQKARLFTAFEQADGSISRRYGGTGLGLVICKNLVEMMGGSIDVFSDGKSYSEFIFDVNMKIGSQKQERRTVADFSSLEIIMVDDDRDSREYFLHICERLNLNAEAVESGKQAIDRFEKKKYDLALVDYVMPEMDGIAVIKKLREINQDCIFVIISGAVSFTEVGDSLKDVKVTHFITKPLFHSTVLNLIGEMFFPKGILKEASVAKLPDFSGRRMLLAEDIEINREIVAELLGGTHVEIVAAENGREAVEIFRSDPGFDVILMDIHMPEMNGYEASIIIRSIPHDNAETIPIIAMTADVFAEDIQNCFDAKMNAHIGKPVNPEELYKLLESYMPARADGGYHGN